MSDNSHIVDGVMEIADENGLLMTEPVAQAIVDAVLMDLEMSAAPVEAPPRPSRGDIRRLVDAVVDAAGADALVPGMVSFGARSGTNPEKHRSSRTLLDAVQRLMGATND